MKLNPKTAIRQGHEPKEVFNNLFKQAAEAANKKLKDYEIDHVIITFKAK